MKHFSNEQALYTPSHNFGARRRDRRTHLQEGTAKATIRLTEDAETNRRSPCPVLATSMRRLKERREDWFLSRAALSSSTRSKSYSFAPVSERTVFAVAREVLEKVLDHAGWNHVTDVLSLSAARARQRRADRTD
eukprot:4062008-Pleurochrysis_carterae.AAC.1